MLSARIGELETGIGRYVKEKEADKRDKFSRGGCSEAAGSVVRGLQIIVSDTMRGYRDSG